MFPVIFISLGPGEPELITVKGLKALQADGIPVKHIPGIPAFIAAGALGGLHVASQEERLTVIPGIVTTEEIERLTSENSAVVIMKLSRCTDEIHRCIRLHPEYRYHYFKNVGTPEEKYINDSKRIAAIRFPYFPCLSFAQRPFEPDLIQFRTP